jgi:hypothetical protein
MKIKKAAFTAVSLAISLCVAGCSFSGSSVQTEIADNTLPSAASETAEPAPLEKYVMNCREITHYVLDESGAGHPAYMEVTDETYISDILGYDMSIAEDSSVNVQLISANLFELTVIRASGDNVKAVKDMLEARKTYLREQAAFYPSQVAAADATRVGEVNGVCYLICSEKSADIEKDLMFHILNN